MTPARKWAIGLGGTVAVVVALAVAVWLQVPSDEELAVQAAARLTALLGVPVTVGAVHWQLRPQPQVVLENVATTQTQPVELAKLVAHISMAGLWERRLQVERAEVMGAVLPQLSLRDLEQGHGSQPAGVEPPPLAKTLQAAPATSTPAAPATQTAPAAPAALGFGFSVDPVPLLQLDFQDVTWISRHGVRTLYAGRAEFDAGWRPRLAQLRRQDAATLADLALQRQGQEDRWAVRARIGGGTADGTIALQQSERPDQLEQTSSGKPAGSGLRLTGKLQPRGIDLVSALEVFKRRSAIGGKLSGDTVVSSSGNTPGELARALHSTTRFKVEAASVQRFDVAKAVRSLGKEHGGTTPLDALSGQIDTQNSAQGMVVDYSQIQARSGAFSASGRAKVANRHIDAEFAVDLADGLAGIPLKVTGPLVQVQVTVPPSALAGAAVGTAVLPGIGTAIGARLGAALGKLFGSDKPVVGKAR